MKNKLVAAVAFLFAASFVGRAQQAFENLSLGIELGTVGVGVELAVPVVTGHVVVKAGFNAPSLSYPFQVTMPADAMNTKIDAMNSRLEGLGLPERIASDLPETALNLRPTLNLSTAKLMVEYYPFRRSSFHLTAGAYVGMGENLISLAVSTDRAFWTGYSAVADQISALNEKYADMQGYVPLESDLMRFNAGGRTFELRGDDGIGYSEAVLRVAKLRPYFGIGFGRSVPRKRVGFQFDIGVWYHGVPDLSSSYETAYDPAADTLFADISVLDRLVLYPQVTLRLTYKIF